MKNDKPLMIFSGNSNMQLAKKVASHLKLSVGKAAVTTFSDGEISVEIQENVRGQDIFIIQPTSQPTNNHIMELIRTIVPLALLILNCVILAKIFGLI